MLRFGYAKSFDQDLTEWQTDEVMATLESVDYMFFGASAFNQSLGWCGIYNVNHMFSGTACEVGNWYSYSYTDPYETSCGVTYDPCPTPAPPRSPPQKLRS